MLTIDNDTDKPVQITARNIRGQDGETTTIEPGDSASIDIDAEHQVVISTTALEPGEVPFAAPPKATLASEAVEAETVDATDDEIREVMLDMRTNRTGLTQGGVADVSELNARLAASGKNSINASRRTELWETLPSPT